MSRSAVLLATALAMVGCAAGEVFHAMDACPGVVLCDELDKAFNKSGVYVTENENQVYCHMESGRWTEVLRRGEDAAGEPLAEADHQSFAPGQDPEPMAAGFGDPAASEFYIGNPNLLKILEAKAPSVQLKVSLLGQDDVRYFSVFDGFSANSDPLTLDLAGLQYRMGTAGHGDLAQLQGAVYDGACTPTVWFGTGTCDGATDQSHGTKEKGKWAKMIADRVIKMIADQPGAMPREDPEVTKTGTARRGGGLKVTTCLGTDGHQGPVLTLPLTEANQRGGRTPWPTLPVELKAVSLQLHTQSPTEACLGLEQHFAFNGDVLNTIENTLPSSVDAEDSFTISCKDSSWILPTKSNSVDSIPSSVNFTCAANQVDPAAGDYRLDNHPVVPGNPCMAPCPAGYSLYIPGRAPETRAIADGPDRGTCLSPPSPEPAKSLVDAAARCGQDGHQLLDFVPNTNFIPGLDTSQPLWLWMRQKTSGLVTQVNSRDEDSGRINTATFKCVQVDYSTPSLVPADCHSDWLGTNPYRNFICMTTVGCGPGAVFHAGFCYWYEATAVPNAHVAECQAKGASPADYTASFVAEALSQLAVPIDGPATPLVGIYKRYGKFWRPDGSVVPVSEFDGDSYGDDALKCAALLPTDPTKLKAINCDTDTDHLGVICQTPGYATLAHQFCSVRYDQLLNSSSSAGPQPTVERTGAMPTATIGDAVTFTCPDGYNIHNLTDFHTLTLTCIGFRDGWQYPAELDAELHGEPLQCVFACNTDESVKPQNSELLTDGADSFFRCLGMMQTVDGSSEQMAICDHTIGQVDTSSLKPCDQCIGSPLIPGDNSTFSSSWDGTTRLEGTVVNYTCLLGLQTPDGDTVQNQTCSANGWEGEVVPCSQCVPLELDLQTELSTLTGPQPFGSLATVSCPAGLQSGDGSFNTSAACMPIGWDWCLTDFNCSYCSGNPPNVSAMLTIESDWDGQQRELNTTVLYTCSAGLETTNGATEQTVNCTGSGWQQDTVQPCEVCSNPPNGSHPTISSTVEAGDGTLGSSLTFVCNSGLRLADGFKSIKAVCTETGWSNCSEDIKCEFCAPLPNLPDGTMDWGSYAGETALDTEVTLTCNPGLAVAGSLQKTQTVVCDLNGWNHTAVKSCTVCDESPPAPASSMTLAWSLGDSQAVYQCPNDTMLPWGEHSYRMQCSPDGWSDCVPECTACVFPPAAGPGVVLVSLNLSRDGIARYKCHSNMTSAGPTELELTCTENGWTEGNMITCDMCAGDPAEAGPAQNRTGNVTGLIGNMLQYECVNSMATEDGLTEQSMTCSGRGWTRPPAPCDHCPLPAAPDNVTRTWDLSVNVTEDRVPVGTNITFFCSNVTAILSSNSTSQTLSCGDGGWSDQPEPCVSCLGDIPDPGNGTDARNVTWGGGRQEGAVVLYTCQNGAKHEVLCVDREWLPAELGPCGNVDFLQKSGETESVSASSHLPQLPLDNVTPVLQDWGELPLPCQHSQP